MYSPVLDQGKRDRALAELAEQEFDLLVVGGGATGAGVALEAVSRGLSVALVEAQDWSAGTSSRSSRLIHGGLRNLYQFHVPVVAEALHERELLRSIIAPHLVSAQPFIWPLLTTGTGAGDDGSGAYDLLAFVGAGRSCTFPAQKYYDKKELARISRALADAAHTGAIRFFDARVDDARLVLAIVRTAVGFGAVAASRVRAERFRTGPGGRVQGARVHDSETGRSFSVRARHVVNATGVWTEHAEALSGVSPGLRVLASKGVHLVVPADRIDSDVGIFVRTDAALIFAVPWDDVWLVGTSDTPYSGDLAEPVADERDVDFVLGQINAILARPLRREDIITTYAGLRPVVRAIAGEVAGVRAVPGAGTAAREHVVVQPVPGLTVVAGGKLTTYRVMAQDTVDAVLGDQARQRPSITARLPLVGASGHTAVTAQAGNIATRTGWSPGQVSHLLRRYGDEIRVLEFLAEQQPSLREPLAAAPGYLRAEVVFATRFEGALHVEDVLRHRTRLAVEQPDAGLGAAAEVAELMAPDRGWSRADQEREVAAYADRCRRLRRAQAGAGRDRAGARGNWPSPQVPGAVPRTGDVVPGPGFAGAARGAGRWTGRGGTVAAVPGRGSGWSGPAGLVRPVRDGDAQRGGDPGPGDAGRRGTGGEGARGGGRGRQAGTRAGDYGPLRLVTGGADRGRTPPGGQGTERT